MVWGGFQNAWTYLVTVAGTLTAVRYCQQIVTPHILPLFDVIMPLYNCHNARYTMDLLQRNNVNVLDWPARSPDLSPVEHMWDIHERHDVNSMAD